MTLDYIHVVRIWLFFYCLYMIKREVQRFSFLHLNQIMFCSSFGNQMVMEGFENFVQSRLKNKENSFDIQIKIYHSQTIIVQSG